MNEMDILLSCINAKLDILNERAKAKAVQQDNSQDLAAVKAAISVQTKEISSVSEIISTLGNMLVTLSEELAKTRGDINELNRNIIRIEDRIVDLAEADQGEKDIEEDEDQAVEIQKEETKTNLIHLAGGGVIRRTWPDQEGVISMVNGGWSYEQIADEYGVDKTAVYNCVYNARKAGKLSK